RLVDAAYAADPAGCGRLDDIEHVIVLIQENRSFDHYFGTYRGVAGFSDPHAVHGVFAQRGYQPGRGPTPDGHLYPFHIDTAKLSLPGMCINNIDHSWETQHHAWNGGRLDSFVNAHLSANQRTAPLTMGYYARGDLPFYYALA